MREWFDYKSNTIIRRDEDFEYGGTCVWAPIHASLSLIPSPPMPTRRLKFHERHRHRYEFNNEYRKILAQHGMLFTGLSPDKNLVEVIELPDHPWFLGCQFHPEFKSRPMEPHPLFKAFTGATLIEARRKNPESSTKRC